MTFTIVSRDSRYPGLTGEYPAPKLAAYAYIARLQSQGRITSTTYHADGAVSVASAGLETMTFAPVAPASEPKYATCQFRLGQPGMTWHCGQYTEDGAKFCKRHISREVQS